MFNFFKNREEKLLKEIPAFAHAHKDLLIIVADPKSDRIFATYKDKFANGKIKSLKGVKANVVKDAIRASQFNTSIDNFIGTIAETLHIPLPKAQEFYKLIDALVFNIARGARKKEHSPQKGAVPSPFIKSQN